MNTVTYLIVLGTLLGIFGILGFRQGWLRELVYLGGLGLSYLLLTEKGSATFRAMSNQLILTVKIMTQSRGDFHKAIQVANELAGKEWVNDGNQALVLTLTIGFVLLVTIMLGTRFKKKKGLVGALTGAVNGYLALNLVLPYLSPYLPKWLPVTLFPEQGTAAPEGAVFRPAIELSEADFKVVISLFFALILIFAGLSIRPKKKRESG